MWKEEAVQEQGKFWIFSGTGASLTEPAVWCAAAFHWQAFTDPTYWIAKVPAPYASLQTRGVWTTVSWEELLLGQPHTHVVSSLCV